MAVFRILLLGPPDIRLDDEAFSIPRRTTRALLFYLASRGGMVGRDELLPLFWENEPEDIARSRLRETLSRLRRALLVQDPLITEPGLVGLNFSSVYVDQLEFQDLIDKAGRLPWQIPIEKPLPDRTYQLLHQAISLWRSPHFLAGADFPSTPGLDNWRIKIAQHMEHLHEHVLERLSDHAYAINDLEQALQLARLALLTDELNEDLHYRALRSLVDMGRRSEAREYFSYLQGLLRRELDTSPGPKLIDLYRQIREDERPIMPTESQPVWNIRPSVRSPFVGRKRVLEQMKQCFHNGGGAFVLGESGQGKTRLLQEFSAHVDTRPRLLLTSCRPAENNLPFQPIIELLRYHIQPDEWLALSPAWASQLSLLLPELTTMRPDLDRPLVGFAPDTAPGQARALLLEAIRQVILLISKEQRLLFCMDDAQWADEASLATIAYLLERPPFDRQALLVLAARLEEKNSHLEALLSSLQQSIHVTLIQLTQLSQEEITDLMQYVLGRIPSEQLTRQVAMETGGNPLFILETLRAMLERGTSLEEDFTRQLPLAESLQNLIRARLQQLSRSARAVLEIGAIIGTEFNPEIIEKVGQQTGAEVVQALEELEGRLLIEPLARSPEDVRHHFIHNKIREVLLQEINPMRARMLHSRVAHILASRSGYQSANQAALLAQHFEYAGEAEQAFNYWMQAARHARQLYSIADAAQALVNAEQLIPQSPELSDEQIYSLYTEWTEMAYEINDGATIWRINPDLLKLGWQRSSSLLIGTALDGLSDACMVGNRFEDGLAYTNQAIPYLERSSNLFEHMEVYNHRGVFLYMLNRIEEAIESFQDALAVGAESTEPKVLHARANAHYQISVARTLSGFPETGLSHATRSLADFITLNQVHGQVTAYSAQALSRFFMGSLVQARLDSQIGIELARRINAWRMLGYLHGYRAMIELASGNIDETLEYAGQAIELGERYGHAEIAAGGYRFIGDIYSFLNDLEQAIHYYQRSLETTGEKFLAVDPMARLGLALYMTGNTEAGQKLLQQATAIARQAGMGVMLIPAQLFQASAFAWVGEWGQAYQLASYVQKEAQRRKLASIRLMASNLLGEIALHADDIPKALEYFENTASEAAAIPYPWIELSAHSMLINTRCLAGQSDQAARQRVTSLLDQLQATVTKEPYRQAFERFRQKFSSE